MAISRLTGEHFELEGNTINFFGAKGTKFANGAWGVNGFIGDVWVEVSPSTILPPIMGCITEDVANGNGEKIAQVQLGARQAVVFFLEGMLTREQLERATEGPTFIDVPDVLIDGRLLTVRIHATIGSTVATADAKGNVI